MVVCKLKQTGRRTNREDLFSDPTFYNGKVIFGKGVVIQYIYIEPVMQWRSKSNLLILLQRGASVNTVVTHRYQNILPTQTFISVPYFSVHTLFSHSAISVHNLQFCTYPCVKLSNFIPHSTNLYVSLYHTQQSQSTIYNSVRILVSNSAISVHTLLKFCTYPGLKLSNLSPQSTILYVFLSQTQHSQSTLYNSVRILVSNSAISVHTLLQFCTYPGLKLSDLSPHSKILYVSLSQTQQSQSTLYNSVRILVSNSTISVHTLHFCTYSCLKLRNLSPHPTILYVPLSQTQQSQSTLYNH
jgi:hypothetical protein